ncbi:hypothetical protein GNZ12_43250 [Paraburkholderia sp. 1N]|uniref:Uncharacterized protein n=1 Tax=Paraburkholderia solitsugae TaxID=2675748 RepID=A0ABX2C6Z1_9BURK|nr:hypothetical protein [Paraburkholderia solitsugae]
MPGIPPGTGYDACPFRHLLFKRIGVRFRGSTSTTKNSNHSWGTAVDLTIAGVLDTRGDNKVQVGLTLLCPINLAQAASRKQA